jgi:hypothetical protein
MNIPITILEQKEYIEISSDLTKFLLTLNMNYLKGVARRLTRAAYKQALL